MREFRDPVLVLGGGLSSLWIARILGRRDIDIYIAVDGSIPYTYNEVIFSKHCNGSFMAPGMRYNREILKNLLRRITRSLSKRVVVYPTNDLDALNLSELKDDLPDDYHFVVGDKEPVEILVKKRKFYEALDRNGINHPVTYLPRDLEDARQIGANVTYPVFIRPSITHLFIRIFGADKKGFIAHSLRELIDYYRLATRYGIEVMFQEIIPGPPSNSYQLEGYYNTDHEATVLFARQRLRIWPPNFGNTTLCVSIPLAKLSTERKTVNEFIRSIRYHGLMSAEFKKDPRDGKLKFLEINARAWLHFWLSAICGVDIVFSSYLDAIGEKIECTQEYETGVKSLILNTDFKASASMFLNGNLSFSEWISSLQGRTKFDLLKRHDLSPFIMAYAKLVHKRAQGIKEKLFSRIDVRRSEN